MRNQRDTRDDYGQHWLGLLMTLKDAETRVETVLHGDTNCTTRHHDALTTLEKLVMLKMLRLDMPHQSTAVAEIETAIRREIKE